MSNIAKRLDKYCLNAARQAVQEAKAEVLQSFDSQTDTGPVTVLKVNVTSGGVKVTIKNQNGRVIENVDAGSAPVGPGTTAIMLAGKKLQ